MRVSPTSILFSAVLLLAACQSADTYRVKGTAESLQDGDTLFLTSDLVMGIPFDTTVVSDGRFSFEGPADTTQLCMVYSALRNDINAAFFTEAGTIDVHLSQQPGEGRVGGTLCNDRWQTLNDSVIAIGREINAIAQRIYGPDADTTAQKQGMLEMERLEQRFSRVVVTMTEENISNEFGFFLLTYYPEELIDSATRMRLIGKLPDELRRRPVIKEIEESLSK